MSKVREYLEHIKNTAPERHKDFVEWLLENGKVYTENEISENFENYQYAVRNSYIKQCYRNAMLAASTYDDLKYVEGFYLVKNQGLPLQHGFNVNQEDKVVDVTAEAVGIPVIEYFGIEIDKKYFMTFVRSAANGLTSFLQWYYLTVVKGKELFN